MLHFIKVKDTYSFFCSCLAIDSKHSLYYLVFMQIRLYKSYDSNVGMHAEDFGPHTCGET